MAGINYRRDEEGMRHLKVKEPDGYTVLYAVLKLSQDITYTDPFTGEERKEKLQGVDGFIPCYKNIEDAEDAACDGKFQIITIKPS